MIKIFYGDDRVGMQQKTHELLGKKYEVIDGIDLSPTDLPDIFWGSSLFMPERKIVLKDCSLNKDVWPLLTQYANTGHQIILWEQRFNKTTKIAKALLAAGVKTKQFTAPPRVNPKLVFDVFKTAWYDGEKAVKMLEKLENTQAPQMFVGLMVTQAIQKFQKNPRGKNRVVLKELSKLDMQLKTTKFANEPWSLIEAFLLRLQDM